MHERAAVSAALNGLMDETGGRLTRVVAALGPGVDQAVVTGIWEETVADTPAAAAELICEVSFNTMRCFGCQTDYPGSKLEQCPACGDDGLVVATAPEFEVLSWAGAN